MAIEDLRARDWFLLPGTLCTEAVFTPFLDSLGIATAQRRPIALRHPAVEDYVAELQTAARDAVICGFSLGAITVAHLADRLPAARLILFGVTPLADDPAKRQDRYDLERDVRAQGGALALGARLPAFSGADPKTARSEALQMAEASGSLIAAQTQLALSRPGALPALGSASCPVFALTGELDTMAPPDRGLLAARAAPLGQFRLLPGCGHYALLENPDLCARSVRALENTPHFQPRAS